MACPRKHIVALILVAGLAGSLTSCSKSMDELYQANDASLEMMATALGPELAEVVKGKRPPLGKRPLDWAALLPSPSLMKLIKALQDPYLKEALK